MASLPVSPSFQNALSNLGAASNGGSETLHVGLNRVDGIPLEADEGSSDGPPVVDKRMESRLSFSMKNWRRRRLAAARPLDLAFLDCCYTDR